MRNPRERLLDILEAIAAIEKYAQRGREAYDQDELIRAWMYRHLEIIGEASRELPSDLRDRHPEVEWQRIIGMRHRFVHHYYIINVEVVWQAVVSSVPAFKPQVEAMLAEFEAEE